MLISEIKYIKNNIDKAAAMRYNIKHIKPYNYGKINQYTVY